MLFFHPMTLYILPSLKWTSATIRSLERPSWIAAILNNHTNAKQITVRFQSRFSEKEASYAIFENIWFGCHCPMLRCTFEGLVSVEVTENNLTLPRISYTCALLRFSLFSRDINLFFFADLYVLFFTFSDSFIRFFSTTVLNMTVEVKGRWNLIQYFVNEKL